MPSTLKVPGNPIVGSTFIGNLCIAGDLQKQFTCTAL